MYQVRWRPSAEQALAELWTSAPDRAEVAKAADAIDALLERDPHAFGEERGQATRIGFVPPLVVLFDINDLDRMVFVWDIWRWPS
jgi:hypothetical protein